MTSAMLTLLAQNDKRSDAFLQRTEDWVVVGLLAGVLLAGAVVLWMVDRWRKRGAQDEKRAGEELTSFRTMYERGEITEEEYNRLRQKVAARVKKPEPPPAPADQPPLVADGRPRLPTPPQPQPNAKPWEAGGAGANGAPPA